MTRFPFAFVSVCCYQLLSATVTFAAAILAPAAGAGGAASAAAATYKCLNLCMRRTCREASGLPNSRRSSPQHSVRPPDTVAAAVAATATSTAAAGLLRLHIASGVLIFVCSGR